MATPNPHVLITTSANFPCATRHLDGVRAAAPGAELRLRDRNAVMADDVAWAEVLFGWPPREHLHLAKGLRWVQLPSAGADRYSDRSLFPHPDFVLTNSRGVFGQPIAEHVLALLLAWSRNLHAYGRQQGSASPGPKRRERRVKDD